MNAPSNVIPQQHQDVGVPLSNTIGDTSPLGLINETNVETLFGVKFTSLSDIDIFSMSIKEGKYADILSTMSSADIDAAVNAVETIGIKFQDEVNKDGGTQLSSSPNVNTSSPSVSPSTTINVPRELNNIDVAATFGVSLTNVGDLHKLINDIEDGKHEELLSEMTNDDRMEPAPFKGVTEPLDALGSICNSIQANHNNAYVIPSKVSHADIDDNPSVMASPNVPNTNDNLVVKAPPSDPIVQSVDISKSYAGAAGASANEQPNVISNFRPLVADPIYDGVNVSIPRKVVEKVSSHFEHTLYVYFIGKRLVFPVVEYYARNNWGKHGLKRIMMNNNGFFFFKFDSRVGLEDVLEGGPWMIRKSPIILKKWSMGTSLLKEELTRIPICVKLHDVPLQVFEDDGRSSFAQCLIEVNSEADLVDVVTIGIPSLTGDDFTKETIRVASPHVVTTLNVVASTVEKTNDGFQTVGKKKKRKGKSKSTIGGQFAGPSVKQTTIENLPKKDNFSTSNSFSALNDEKEDDEEVENVYDESANLFKTGGRSSFTTAAG
ncbi:zinc knuckle CX2CX4HX4C containing protein [Tanacetum coccineum]